MNTSIFNSHYIIYLLCKLTTSALLIIQISLRFPMELYLQSFEMLYCGNNLDKIILNTLHV